MEKSEEPAESGGRLLQVVGYLGRLLVELKHSTRISFCWHLTAFAFLGKILLCMLFELQVTWRKLSLGPSKNLRIQIPYNACESFLLRNFVFVYWSKTK